MTAWRVIGPGETLFWGFDWDDNDWLGSQTLSTSTWTISPTGPTLSSPTMPTTTTTQTKITGCTFGVQYTLRNAVTTSGGETGVRDIILRCTGSP